MRQVALVIEPDAARQEAVTPVAHAPFHGYILLERHFGLPLGEEVPTAVGDGELLVELDDSLGL